MLKISGGPEGWGIKVEHAETGASLLDRVAITDIAIEIKAGEPVRAGMNIELVQLEIESGAVRWLTKHPERSELAEVKAIEFADGTRVEFADVPTVVEKAA